MTAEERRQNIQRELDAARTVEERRRLGQFATPPALASEIVSYGLGLLGRGPVDFLEPAVGTGAFFAALLSSSRGTGIREALGFEVDSRISLASEGLWKESGLVVRNADFTKCEPGNKKFNLLLTNPPYVRHHLIPSEDKRRLGDAVLKETGIALNGLSGLYCHFILLAHKWLEDGAVSGWLVPSEFMDVNYGIGVKRYLLEKVQLLRIHRYDPKECLFGDALVSSSVVWFRNERPDGNRRIEFSFGGTHGSPRLARMVSRAELLAEPKWTRLAEEKGRPSASSPVPRLGDFFDIRRGIATGDNSFFILDRGSIEKLGMDMDFFVPVLPSPRNLKTDEVGADEAGWPALDNQSFLLSCSLPLDEIRRSSPSLWEYLRAGESVAGSRRLCRHRSPWYAQETRKTTPFLCSYMGRGDSNGRGPFRFVLNHSKAIVTNSYLMLYPKPSLLALMKKRPGALGEIWTALKKIGRDEMESQGRIYGGGLKKIEPKELGRVPCPALGELAERSGIFWRTSLF